jgi:hypothetical protein
MPYHFGYYRNPSDEGGVPLEYKLLPQVLAASPAKYTSHAVGKVCACARVRVRAESVCSLLPEH